MSWYDYFNPWEQTKYTWNKLGLGDNPIETHPAPPGSPTTGTGPDGRPILTDTGLPAPYGVDEGTRQALLAQQGGRAGMFADQAERGYAAYGAQGQAGLAALQRQMSGQDSVSAEQLRQGLGQQLAQQRSMAAGASPRNAAGAARTAAIQMGRASTAMAGQQATAGLAERNQATNQYGQLLGQLRGQDLSAATQSRQNALGGYGAGNTGPPQPSWIQQYGPAIAAGAAAVAASDRALKTNIAPGDAAANAAMDALQAPAPTSPFANPVTTGLDSFNNQIAAAAPAAAPPASPAAPTGPAWWQRLAGGVATGLRALPAYPQAYSDRALKTNIKPGEDEVNAAINGLRPYTYAYKDPALGAGPQVGVMAQDLQKAGLGQAVVKTPIGLAIDPGKLSGANTAMIAALGRRVAELEGTAAPGSPAAQKAGLLARRGRDDPQGEAAQRALDGRRARIEDNNLYAAGAYPTKEPPDTAAIQAQSALDRRRATLAALARGAQLAQGPGGR